MFSKANFVMMSKLVFLVLIWCVTVSAEWKWRDDPIAAECKQKIMGDTMDIAKNPCWSACIGQKEGYVSKI